MIKYITGNALEPIGEGNKIIVHCCNDIGKWGSGFVVAISKKWREPEIDYRSMPLFEMKLGNVQFVSVETNIVVANMIGQHDIKSNMYNVPPLRYEAVEVCLKRVAEYAKQSNSSIHMPRIGCGLAGGKWSIMERVIESSLGDIDVYVYDFEDKKSSEYVKANLK